MTDQPSLQALIAELRRRAQQPGFHSGNAFNHPDEFARLLDALEQMGEALVAYEGSGPHGLDPKSARDLLDRVGWER